MNLKDRALSRIAVMTHQLRVAEETATLAIKEAETHGLGSQEVAELRVYLSLLRRTHRHADRVRRMVALAIDEDPETFGADRAGGYDKPDEGDDGAGAP